MSSLILIKTITLPTRHQTLFHFTLSLHSLLPQDVLRGFLFLSPGMPASSLTITAVYSLFATPPHLIKHDYIPLLPEASNLTIAIRKLEFFLKTTFRGHGYMMNQCEHRDSLVG